MAENQILSKDVSAFQAERPDRVEDCLLREQTITSKDVDQAKMLSSDTNLSIPQALLRLGAVAEDDILTIQSKLLGINILDREHLPNEAEDYRSAISLLKINGKWLLARGCAIWQTPNTSTINVIARDILDQEVREFLEPRAHAAGQQLCYLLASQQTVDSALYYISEDQKKNADQDISDSDAARLREMAEEAPVIDFVNRIFSLALKENASDIHIEPFETQFVVRFRIDGILHTKQSESRKRFDAVASRIKILSNMDIAERRLPQDGRQSIRFAGQEIDLRVSSLPGTWGESIVLRLLLKGSTLPNLKALGLEGPSKSTYESMISHPNGIVVVTGPTGSGKSTTLYRSLQSLNDGIRKIITVEDPVEYNINGIIQVQTNARIGYTFASGLRAILRQDPDIIMVGEIRDGETATMAAQAALTGHLVLSTLHTNSALAAVTRLIDIGLEPFMVVSAVRGFVAQRLLRRLCPRCKVSAKSPKGEELVWNIISDKALVSVETSRSSNWHVAKGCPDCSHTGYQGRVAIFEAVEMTEALSEVILSGASEIAMMKVARKQGFVKLFEDGILKARTGVTSVEEVIRVCGDNREPTV